eukprot:15452080-Alexandrium_andersonii.AAC.3
MESASSWRPPVSEPSPGGPRGARRPQTFKRTIRPFAEAKAAASPSWALAPNLILATGSIRAVVARTHHARSGRAVLAGRGGSAGPDGVGQVGWAWWVQG